jgi:hypothetical protein
VRAIHLHDIALLAARMEPTDWQELRSPQWPDRWCLVPPLLLTSRYFSRVIDAGALDELVATCPRWLTLWARRQTLSDVSASNPRQMALPELAWCRSPTELVRYVKMRLVPEHGELHGFRGLAETTDYGKGQRWFTMSHPMRIATWIFGRPIRPGTLHAVRRGLGYTGTICQP